MEKLEKVYFHNVLTKKQVIRGLQRRDVNNVDDYVKLNLILLVAKQSIRIYKCGFNNNRTMTQIFNYEIGWRMR